MPAFDFNVSDYQPNTFELIEPGEYDAVVVESERKQNSKGDGALLKIKVQILNGKYQNRTLYDNLNLWNASQKACMIARETLSAIAAATGVANPSASEMLHDKPMKIKVAVEKRADNGEMRNVIKGYKPARQSAPVSQPEPAEGKVGKPW
jgi:hypothetical protein